MLDIKTELAAPPGIGHNGGPPPTPYELAEKEINDLYDECKLWLDGAKVDSQELADGIGNLLASLRVAEKHADEARIAEKAPHDAKIAEIQARYAPLIADTKTTKGKTVLAAEACKKALEPWLAKIKAEQEAAAKKAREEAEAKQRAAEEALRAADAANLEARAAAEALLKDAKKADRIANKAERSTATAGGAVGRSVGLRTVYAPVLTDGVQAARHYWGAARDEMLEFLQGLAERDVRAGRREIPGFEIKKEERAV